MSMYEVAVADGRQQARGAVLLAVLGNPAVARFRDCWCEKGDDGPVIHLYTRQGGPNREAFASGNKALREHPLYLRDADDEMDSTYCSFWFSSPPMREMREALAAVAVEPVDTAARWREAFARVRRGELRPSEVAGGGRMAATFTCYRAHPAFSRVMRQGDGISLLVTGSDIEDVSPRPNWLRRHLEAYPDTTRAMRAGLAFADATELTEVIGQFRDAEPVES